MSGGKRGLKFHPRGSAKGRWRTSKHRRHLSIAGEIAPLRLFEAGLDLGKLPGLARNEV
jgi:hypothetical protein